jgi:N-acetylmuramoyl-L-alanine amidase
MQCRPIMRITTASRFRSAAARLLPCIGLALLFLLSGYRLPMAGAANLPVATAARVAGDESRTRFVADLTAPVGYTVYVLPDPYRVVIDLPQVSFEMDQESGRNTRGLVSEYRYGPVAEGRSRIVLDTNGPVLIEKSFILEPEAGQPARIVVDLVKSSEADFAARLQADEPASLAAIGGASAEAEVETASPQPRPRPGSEASALPDEKPARTRSEGRRLVVIDPGHGGIDPGAIGVGKTKEKDVVLAYGLALRKVLEAVPGLDVVMTRSDDRFLTLKERVRIARENEADLFIAIHADTVRGPEARGATIYTLSEKASDAEAEALAHKENRADIIAGVDLETENEEVTDILIDLVQRESKTHALVFAKKAVAEMKPVTAFTGKPMRSAGFMVLKAPDVPSVLVELGYLSSRHDEKQLTSPAWRQEVAEAMGRAVEKFFAQQLAAKAP